MNYLESLSATWDFHKLAEIKYQQAKIDFRNIPSCCEFLAAIGYLDKVSDILKEINANSILYAEVSSLSDYGICLHLQKVIDELIALNKNDKESFFSDIYKKSIDNTLSDLHIILKSKWKKNINPDISAENNMIIHFAFNKLFKSKLIDVDLAVLLIDHMFLAKNFDDIRKKTLLCDIINYFYHNSELNNCFFRLKEQYYNHLQKLMSMINHLSNGGSGANYLMDKLFSSIRNVNNLQIVSDSSPKIAICISGMLRGDLRGIESIFKLLAEPLGADVFMHTWDVQQDWIGGARASVNFWLRTFGIDASKVPKNLLDLKFLENNFPNVFNAVMTESFSPFDKETILDRFNFVSLLSENQTLFMENYMIDDNYKARNTFNQIKMFYGIYKAFSLLKEHEKMRAYRYDYIIKARPDLIIKKGLSLSDLKTLDSTSIAIPTGDYGIHDMIFYSCRDVYEQIVNLFEKMIEAKHLSPFVNYPKYDCHALLFAWLLYKNIKPALCDIKYSLSESTKNLKIPNLKEALADDCSIENHSKYPEETNWIKDFFKDKCK